MEKLKISFLSYMGVSATPPKSYGGEIIYWNIVDELAKMGHEVTLYASPGSMCPENGKLVELSNVDERNLSNPLIEHRNIALNLYEILSSDIVHDGSNYKYAHYYANLLGKENNALVQLISIDHNNLVYPNHVVTISRKQAEIFLSSFTTYFTEPIPHPIHSYRQRFFGVVNPLTVYPDIDLELYEPCYDKEDYVCWVSRMHPDKGPVEAIKACVKAGVKLKMSGDISHHSLHREYFEKVVKPLMDKYGIEYVPTPDRRSLIEFIRKARAMIFPVNYNEAFGYVALECLALGTPVITSCRGALPEIVVHGRSGYIVPYSVEAFAEALSKVDELKPEEARKRATYFRKGNGAKQFYNIYKTMLDGKWPSTVYPTLQKT